MYHRLTPDVSKGRLRSYLHSITTVLVVALLVSFIVPLSVGLMYSLHVERSRLNSLLENYHEQLLDSLEPSMENALRNFEPNEAQNAAKIAIHDPRVLHIRVYSSIYEMLLVDMAKVPGSPSAIYRFKRRNLLKGGEQLGYVEVAVDGARYDRILARERSNIIMLFSGMLVCGLLLVIPTIYFKIIRPLNRLMREAEELSSGELDTALQWKGNDELSRLGNMLETMRQRLHANIRRVEELAAHDELTGMPNRRTFFKQAGQALDFCRRYGQPLVVGLMDLDLFKQVNDTLGHGAGDSILKEFAAVMQDTLRKTDICARIGGEEFVLCLPGTTLQEALIVAEKFRARLRSHPFSHDQTVTVSMGLAEDTRLGPLESLEILVQNADQAMYRAKKQGRNQVVVFSPSVKED